MGALIFGTDMWIADGMPSFCYITSSKAAWLKRSGLTTSHSCAPVGIAATWRFGTDIHPHVAAALYLYIHIYSYSALSR